MTLGARKLIPEESSFVVWHSPRCGGTRPFAFTISLVLKAMEKRSCCLFWLLGHDIFILVLQDKSSGGNQGLRQRAEALAALNSAFNSSGSKPSYSVNVYLKILAFKSCTG